MDVSCDIDDEDDEDERDKNSDEHSSNEVAAIKSILKNKHSA